ncbi:hypothetical protein [Microlunatus sp. GCM10028923]|uniref:hypothetical protein n=1 Tax=Microlunatus sp. GCM10028923 TaxID=3273400 RepID=UPI00360D8DED
MIAGLVSGGDSGPAYGLLDELVRQTGKASDRVRLFLTVMMCIELAGRLLKAEQSEVDLGPALDWTRSRFGDEIGAVAAEVVAAWRGDSWAAANDAATDPLRSIIARICLCAGVVATRTEEPPTGGEVSHSG